MENQTQPSKPQSKFLGDADEAASIVAAMRRAMDGEDVMQIEYDNTEIEMENSDDE